MMTWSVINWAISFFVTRKCQKIEKNQWKPMKKANIDREIIHIFSTTWAISVEFSGKVWLMMILKATKKTRVSPSL